jgi:hypothetical protein
MPAVGVGPMDDYLAHQTPETFGHVYTGDRAFYDRYYFNCHSCSDEIFLITGMGQYPNLGVLDAFVTVSMGDKHYCFMIKVYFDEDADGNRHMEEAVRVPRLGSDEPVIHLGSPRHEITFKSGTREIAQTRLRFAHSDLVAVGTRPGASPSSVDSCIPEIFDNAGTFRQPTNQPTGGEIVWSVPSRAAMRRSTRTE